MEYTWATLATKTAEGTETSLSWDVTAAPVVAGGQTIVRIVHNGLAVIPTAVSVSADRTTVTYTPADGFTAGDAVWGEYPAAFEPVSATVGQGRAGRHLRDRATALARLKDYAAWTSSPALSEAEVGTILDRNLLAAPWEPETTYYEHDRVVPTETHGPTGWVYGPARNASGTFGGVSGADEPEWQTYTRWPGAASSWLYGGGGGQYRNDGTLRWEIKDVEGPALWDLTRAAYECWQLKAQKCAGLYATSIDGNSFHPEQAYRNCCEMADRYSPMGIA